MKMMLGIVAILLMMLVVIGLHELGHALVARCFGVGIQRISMGFGKILYRIKGRQGIEWTIGRWPFGGYVQLLNSRIQPVTSEQQSRCFDKQSPWIRCVILLAGGVVNFLVAWIAMTLVFSLGYTEYTPIIDKVAPNSVMAVAGLQSGDQLMSIEGQSIHSWQQAGMDLIGQLGQASVHMTVLRQQTQHQLVFDLTPEHYRFSQGSLLTRLGLIPQMNDDNFKSVPGESFGGAMLDAAHQVIQWIAFYGMILKKWLMGLLPFSMLLGPIGLLMATMDSLLHGITAFLLFLGMLSVAVGVANFLPLPGLDGGSMLYALLEKIRGQPLSVAMEVLLHRLAVIVFSVFLVQLILNDIARWLI